MFENFPASHTAHVPPFAPYLPTEQGSQVLDVSDIEDPGWQLAQSDCCSWVESGWVNLPFGQALHL